MAIPHSPRHPAAQQPAPQPDLADVNGDGTVNILDLVSIASSFGQTGETAADLNGDGAVNILDLILAAGAIGNAAAAPALHTEFHRYAYIRGSQTVALPGTAVGYHRPDIPKGNTLLRATPRLHGSERDAALSKLSEPV